MSFIQKNDSVIINTKLTNIGRQLLASGNLTFKKIEFGDSEVDYNFLRDFDTTIVGTDLSIMRPKDANPIIKYPIPVLETDATGTKSDINKLTPDIRLVVNTAKQRGFFTGSTSLGFTALTSTTYILNKFNVATSSVSGGTVLNVPSVTNITAGTMLLIDWRNPELTFTDTTGTIGENYPRQFLWYKVQSVVGSAVTVDRALPNFNNAITANDSVVYVYPPNNAIDNYYSTGTTVAYWNYNTLAFDSTCNIGQNDDVVVWNMNIVYKDTPIGVTSDYTSQYYDGAIFSGFKEYIQGETDNSVKSQFAIIHYTNKSISNYYGEAFYNDTFKLTLPTIMYHGKKDRTMGIVLSASTKRTVLSLTLPNFSTEFYDLVETTSQNVVGKVFNDLRIAVIEDEELVNVLALKSDRSHTLPPATWSLKNELSSTDALLPQNGNKYIALTYLFTNENISNGYNSNRSFGLNGGIHCGYVEYLYPTTTEPNNVTFYFKDADLKFMESNVTTNVDGTGFNVNKFYVLAQLVDINTFPNPKTWRLIDYTGNLPDVTNWTATTMPVTALTSGFNTLTKSQYTAATIYNIENWIGTLPTNFNYLTTPQLGFGEESILLGNINTNIKATVFKTKISHTLGFSNYNTSNNPTWDVDDDIYVTEAAIYDQNNSLVAVGKINNPVKKNTNKLFTVELDMDF